PAHNRSPAACAAVGRAAVAVRAPAGDVMPGGIVRADDDLLPIGEGFLTEGAAFSQKGGLLVNQDGSDGHIRIARSRFSHSRRQKPPRWASCWRRCSCFFNRSVRPFGEGIVRAGCLAMSRWSMTSAGSR